jgi:hypothetical protein
MIKAMAHTAKGDIIVLGISAENVRRLIHGQPILFDPAALHIELGTPIAGITLFYGETTGVARLMKTFIGPRPRSSCRRAATRPQRDAD